MKNNVRYFGELEIDWARGVIYFHAAVTGTTILRICNLPKLINPPLNYEMLDISHMNSAYWSHGNQELAKLPESLEVLNQGLKEVLEKWLPKLEEQVKKIEELKNLINEGV